MIEQSSSIKITKGAAMSERIVEWVRTSQVPGSRLSGYGTFSTELLTGYHHNSIIKD